MGVTRDTEVPSPAAYWTEFSPKGDKVQSHGRGYHGGVAGLALQTEAKQHRWVLYEFTPIWELDWGELLGKEHFPRMDCGF